MLQPAEVRQSDLSCKDADPLCAKLISIPAGFVVTKSTCAKSMLDEKEALTDKVIPLNGLDNAHVGAWLLLHIQLLNPAELIPARQVSNDQGICHAVCLHSSN